MLVGRSLGEARAQPEGGYVAGQSWLYFGIDSSVFGHALWGTPTPEDLQGLVQVMELELELDREPPHAAIVDVSSVDALGQDGFEVLAGYVMRHGARLAQIVTQTAMVRSTGLNGAIASGFFDIVGSPFPARVSCEYQTTERHWCGFDELKH